MKLVSFFFLIFFQIFSLLAQVHPVLVVVGTRPEGIKMIPVFLMLKNAGITALLCSTGQHTDLLDDTFKIFNVKPDINLAIMKPGQDLFYITTTVLDKMKAVLQDLKPSLVLVQGDTTSAMTAALAAFYLKIPVGHVEAGLRTGNKYGPFPEEINRMILSAIATYHFAPTQEAVNNLIKEHIDPESIFCTGNTVVDALHTIQHKIKQHEISISTTIQDTVVAAQKASYKLMLLTAHRRESFDGGLNHIFSAIKQILAEHPELFVIYPMHPNPAIKIAADQEGLNQVDRITICKPLSYSDLVYVLEHCDVIATDSGGIQEEGVSLGKNVIILRNETDRAEGVYEGLAHLVGTDEDKIKQTIAQVLSNDKAQTENSVYGNGTASAQIAQIVKKIISKEI